MKEGVLFRLTSMPRYDTKRRTVRNGRSMHDGNDIRMASLQDFFGFGAQVSHYYTVYQMVIQPRLKDVES